MRVTYEVGEPMPYVGAREPVYEVTRRWSWRRLAWIKCSKRIGYLERV